MTANWIEVLKPMSDARWSKTNRCWYVLNQRANLKALFRLFKGIAWIDTTNVFKQQATRRKVPARRKPVVKKLSEEQQNAVDWYRKWMQSKGYSDNTINTYTSLMETFFTWLGDKKVREVRENDVINFNSEFIVKTNRSPSYQRQVINAVKLFYNRVNGHDLQTEKLERVRKWKKLPEVLSQEEVQMLIKSYNNLKHKTMIMLIYCCGLRRSEVLNLKWKDIDRKRMILSVRLGKGNKDRQVVLPEKALKQLETYYRNYKPQTTYFVFEGEGGGQYSGKSFLQVLKQGLRRTGIKKDVTLHSTKA